MAKGTIVKRGKNSWRLKFDISPDPVSGNRRTKYATFKGGKREAENELARLIARANEGLNIAPGKLLFGDFLIQWLENNIKPSVRANTYEGYEINIRKHIAPRLGNIPLKDLTALHIQEYYTQMAKAGRSDGKGGLSAQTIVHHHRRIKQALKHALNARLISYNPSDAVTPPKVTKDEIVVLSRQELLTMLESLSKLRIRNIVFLAASTGMRRSELLGLRWCDVDMDGGYLTVNQVLQQTNEHGLQFTAPKTKSSRRKIAIPSPTTAMLKKWKVKQDQEHLKLGAGKDTKRLVFTRRDGEPYSPRAISKEFERLIAAMDITQITLHGLRHTHISHLLRDNVNVKVVSARAGHASASITLDIYGHLIDNMDEAAAASVGRWFSANEDV
jgi:integrase